MSRSAAKSVSIETQGWSETRLQEVFDQALQCINRGDVETALPLLAGVFLNVEHVAAARALLQSHPLHSALLEDPYTAQAFHKPRGYAGDALVMDMIYDQMHPDGVSVRGHNLFAATTAFPVAQAVRDRLKLASQIVKESFERGDRICSLACGHFREFDNLSDRDLSTVTAVDQDPLSVKFVRSRHNNGLDLREMSVFSFLSQAIKNGEKFDLIYSLGFTDYCDLRAMDYFYKLMTRCLSDNGSIFVGNFAPDHIARGWLEVCLDWHLTYRNEAEMESHARQHGLTCELFRDDTSSIIYSHMRRTN